MFGRNSADQTLPKPPQGSQLLGNGPGPVGQAMPNGTSAPVRSSGIMSTSSVIGPDLTIVGERITIISQNTLMVDGIVRGDINGREVIVGPGGKVTGTITAQSVDVRGAVHGAIKGMAVTLQPSARVDGDIHHQTLTIAEGAEFDGRVRRPKDMSELTPVLDPAAFQSAIQAAE